MNQLNKGKITEKILYLISQHPYLFLLGICLLMTPFCFGAVEYIPKYAPYIEAFIVFAAALLFGVYRYRCGKIDMLRLGIFLFGAALADIAAMLLYLQSSNKALWHFVGGCASVILLYKLADARKFRTKVNSFLIIGLGFCLKFYYVLITSVGTRQHDVSFFGDEAGHAGYIEYLLFNHKLPDFDVRDRWQFCHPPLHHAISAAWIFLNENILGFGHDQARESLQMLTLFYSGCIIISAYRILRHFALEDEALYIPLMIVSFHPAFILFSGSINNDVLSAALVMGAVICTLKWYKCPTLKNILKIALCIGLAMMTKVAAATVAPPVALVFLIVFIKRFKTDRKKLFGQFCCFGAICVPLALWFGIRNYIKWKVPLTYVAKLETNDPQYIGDIPFLKRMTDFSPFQFASPYEQWDFDGGDGYFEYNPLITLLKNSLFGESINEKVMLDLSYLHIISIAFLWLNVVIAGYALFVMIKMCVKKCSAEPTEKIFLVGFYVFMMAVFIKNSATYPFTCTMNYRYITPTAIIGAVFIGLSLKYSPEKKFMRTVLSVLAALFTAASTIIYLALK